MTPLKRYPRFPIEKLEDLAVHLDEISPKLSREESSAMNRYTSYNWDDENHKTGENGSKRLNDSLLHGHTIHPVDLEIHNAINKLAAPTGKHLAIYSGGSNLSAYANTHSKLLYSPAHISGSFLPREALHHAHTTAKRRGDLDLHINKIDVEPHHKVAYPGAHSDYPEEQELIIPAGGTIRYTHTTHHDGTRKFNRTKGYKIYMHHFKLENQK